jgi:PKD repeat protein
MAVADVFKVFLYAEPIAALNDVSYPFTEGEDITSGILNVDIQYGTDTYEGPQQQIDSGQFVIVTRNPAMDPKINPNLRYNSAIKFWDERTGEFFRGYVTDVQVQYQRNDNPIITITGTDIFGAAQRVVIDQDTHDAIMALSTGTDWNGLTFSEFIPYMGDFTSKYLEVNGIVPPGYPAPAGFWFESSQAFGELDLGNLRYSPARYIPQVGETYLDVMNKYAQTNLTSFNAKSSFGDPMSYNYINVSVFPKYDPNYWPPESDPYLTYTDYDFSSDPADEKPYETILIDNGYNRVINQVDISNEYRFVDTGELNSVSENFIRTSAESIEQYAISTANVSTIYPSTTPGITPTSWANRYSQNILQLSQFPGQEIQQITFDNARYEDIQNESSYSDYTLNQMIRIKHQLNDEEVIDRIYDIAGITHSISPDKWEMGFTLKPSASEYIFKLQGETPTLAMNATSGDANFNFTATIENIDPARISSVLWALSATDANEIGAIYPYATSGNMFKNGEPRYGNTQTWNFDDDGILAAYSFDPDSTPQSPTDNRYGGYGPGTWYVYAIIFLSTDTRGMIVLQQELTVGTPEVEADFGWTQNLTNNFGQVSFVDTSVNHEVGEPDSYAWDFGDGTTSAERNPTHVYEPGPTDTEYDVSLTVYAFGPGETKVYNTHTETVTLTQPTMTANFTWVESPAGTVVFTNTSTNVGFEEPDAYFWEFGDGTTSTLKNPTKTYSAPPTVFTDFSVTLTTKNIWEQTSSVTKTVTVSPLYNTGTLPVNQIGIETSPYFQNGTTFIAYLKALRSDGTNLSFNALTSAPNQTYKDITNNPTTLPGTQLTRNPATSSGVYGLKRYGGTRPGNLLLTSIPVTQNINSIKMLFDDKYPAATYALTIWDRVYATANDSFGGTYPIGYWDLPAIPNYAPRQSYGREYTMTPIRPMPPRIPYFKYTFDNRTVSFTSVETADSYAWNFGDGTTSTVKNPVKTYSAAGTYNVTLAVTNGGVVTRTTTEPVIVESIVGYPIRYIKLAQKEHTGINAWDTPHISNIEAVFNRNALVQTAPVSHFYVNPINIAKSEGYSMEWYAGTASPDAPNEPRTFNPLSSALGDNKRPYEGGGLRVKSLDGTFKTKWELTADFGTAISNIDQFRGSFSRWSNYDGTPNPVCAGISYEIYVTDYVGAPAGIASATWTKIGDFNPTNMPLNPNTTASAMASVYKMTPL